MSLDTNHLLCITPFKIGFERKRIMQMMSPVSGLVPVRTFFSLICLSVQFGIPPAPKSHAPTENYLRFTASRWSARGRCLQDVDRLAPCHTCHCVARSSTNSMMLTSHSNAQGLQSISIMPRSSFLCPFLRASPNPTCLASRLSHYLASLAYSC